MYEIPEILVFVCMWMLFVFGAAVSSRWKSAAILTYALSAVVASVMLLGFSYAWVGIGLATVVFAVFAVALDWAEKRRVTAKYTESDR